MKKEGGRVIELTATAREAAKGEKPPKVGIRKSHTSNLQCDMPGSWLLCSDIEGCGSWDFRAAGSSSATMVPGAEQSLMSSGAYMSAQTQMRQAGIAQVSLAQGLAQAVLFIPTKEPATGLAQQPSGRGLCLASLPSGKGLSLAHLPSDRGTELASASWRRAELGSSAFWQGN